jgi:O-antigen ligase
MISERATQTGSAPRPALLLCQTGLLVHALFAPLSIAGTQIGLGLAFAGLLLAALRGWRPARSPLDLPALVFVLLCLLSEAFADGGLPDLGHATLWRSLLSFFVVLHALSLLPDARAAAARMLLAAALGLAFAGGLGIFQYFTPYDLLYRLGLRATPAVVLAPGVPGRFGAMGLFTSRLTFGHVVLVLLSLLGGALISGALSRSFRAARAAAALACALGLAGLLLTFDRAATLGLFASAAVLGAGLLLRGGWQRHSRARVWLGLAIALCALATVGLPQVRARLATAISLEQNQDRVFLWSRALEIIRDHPVTGVGFGNYRNVCSRYYDRVDPTFFMRTWAHCSPLSILAETGPLGLLAGAWLVFAAVRALWLRLREGAPHALGALAALAGLGLAGLFHDLVYDTKVMLPLWTAVALGLAVPAAPSENAPS